MTNAIMSGLRRKTARHRLLSHIISLAVGASIANLVRSNMCVSTATTMLKQKPVEPDLGQGDEESAADPTSNRGESLRKSNLVQGGDKELADPSPDDGKSIMHVPPYTVVITAHPIPSHPSLKHIEGTMDSLGFLNPKPDHVILACDFPQKLHGQYRQFKEAFRVRYPHVEIVEKDSPWDGICGNIKSGFGAAKTEFILTVQVT